MGKVTGFKEFERVPIKYRPAIERLKDANEIYQPYDEEALQTQASRCMDCGVPFCQSEDGCPVYNLIPEWNDLIYRGDWKEALNRLHATNNFPEFTGRVCPAPCEGSCVLGVTDPAVTIKNIEKSIIDKGFEEGWVVPNPPLKRTGKKVAIIGSGPAGLAAADQLNKVGHTVTVFERADRIGGLLMYGIPNMKLEKEVVDRRVNLLKAEGILFETNVNVGVDSKYGDDFFDQKFDAILLATGATKPRNLDISGRHYEGIHFAMDFLTENTDSILSDKKTTISAEDKHVIVIGGGDTGTDCIATSLRHGCKSLVNFELFPKPPADRLANNPWPTWPRIYRTDYGHEEAEAVFGEDPRTYAISSVEFLSEDSQKLSAVKTVEVEIQEGRPVFIEGTEKIWQADLVFLALGFLGPETEISTQFGIELDSRGNYLAQKGNYQTNSSKVFATGDCRSGQSLVVRAINEGREAARSVDIFLMGETTLP